jgi:hypothetical protein
MYDKKINSDTSSIEAQILKLFDIFTHTTCTIYCNKLYCSVAE